MNPFERLKRWLENQLQKEQEELSRKKLFLLRNLRLVIYVLREIFTGEYPVRAAALVFSTLLAIVPVATVSFSFFRAFGGLHATGIEQRVRQELTSFLLGDAGPLPNRDALPPEDDEEAPQGDDGAEANGPPPDAETPAPAPEGADAPDDDEAAPPGPGPPPDDAPPPGTETPQDAEPPGLLDWVPRDEAPDAEESPEAQSQRLIAEWSHQISELIDQLANKASGAQTNLLSILLLTLSAVLLFNTVETTFNRIWRVKARRNFWVKFPVFFTVLILGPFLVGTGILLASEFDPAMHMHSFSPFGQQLAGRAYSALLTSLAFFFAYKLLPFTHVRWRPALIGALAAAVAWEAAKWGFGLYVQRAMSYSRIYGPLAAFPIFLLWLHLTWMIVLFGAGLAYVSQNIERISERERPPASPVSERLALAILVETGRRFVLGESPPTMRDLSDALEVRPEEAQRTAAELARAHLVVAAGEDGETCLLPGRSLDRIAVADVLRVVDEANQGVCRLRDAARREALEGFLAEMDALRAPKAQATTLRELVERALEAA